MLAACHAPQGVESQRSRTGLGQGERQAVRHLGPAGENRQEVLLAIRKAVALGHDTHDQQVGRSIVRDVVAEVYHARSAGRDVYIFARPAHECIIGGAAYFQLHTYALLRRTQIAHRGRQCSPVACTEKAGQGRLHHQLAPGHGHRIQAAVVHRYGVRQGFKTPRSQTLRQGKGNDGLALGICAQICSKQGSFGKVCAGLHGQRFFLKATCASGRVDIERLNCLNLGEAGVVVFHDGRFAGSSSHRAHRAVSQVRPTVPPIILPEVCRRHIGQVPLCKVECRHGFRLSDFAVAPHFKCPLPRCFPLCPHSASVKGEAAPIPRLSEERIERLVVQAYQQGGIGGRSVAMKYPQAPFLRAAGRQRRTERAPAQAELLFRRGLLDFYIQGMQLSFAHQGETGKRAVAVVGTIG